MKIRQRLAVAAVALAVVLPAAAPAPVQASLGPPGWGCKQYVICVDWGRGVVCRTLWVCPWRDYGEIRPRP